MRYDIVMHPARRCARRFSTAAAASSAGTFDVAPLDASRAFVLPAAVLGSIPFGAFYSWSVMNSPMTRLLGVVAPSGSDWTLADVLPIFTINGATFGFAMAIFGGRAVERYGPRRSMLAGAALWSSGLAVGGLGAADHNLIAVLGGYGFLGGLGVALGYLAPMALLQRWYPDARGFAAGVSVAGFGELSFIYRYILRDHAHSLTRSP
jgi:MFS family permease